MAKVAPQPMQYNGPPPVLPPELLARLRRMSVANGRTMDQELSALVTLAWVKFGGKEGKW